MSKELQTAPKWHERWAITEEAASHLWEIAASYVMELEDQGKRKPGLPEVWKLMHERHPEWYPAKTPSTLHNHWWYNEDWRAYLAVRRQEHILRTMPSRLQIRRYYTQMHDLFSNMLLDRAMSDPDSFSNKQLLEIVRETSTGLDALDKDVQVAAGAETGNTIKIDVFQFLDKLPRDRQNVVIAKMINERVHGELESGE